MSSCLSGGGRAYRLDLDIIKSPTTSWASNSSSPSSTLSESSKSSLAISTRKARTPRKRPNQTYNEAAAILSTAYPKIFPTKHLKNPFRFTKSHQFPFEPSELLILEKPDFSIEPKLLNLFEKPCEKTREVKNQETCDDFDAESILDEEVEEGIDSIMGNSRTERENETIQTIQESNIYTSILMNSCCYGYPVGLVGFDYGYGMRKELRGVRSVVDDERDCWRFPSVNVADITKKIAKIPVETKKKNKNRQSCKGNLIPNVTESKESLASTASSEESIHQPNAGLLLKLNYDDVLNAWSDKGSPFSGDAPAGESAGNDVQARLAQIDLFSEEGAGRDAIVLRYKEKRRTRLVSKKIRYQVRKVNADQRPRIKGRFVRTPNSPNDD